MRLYRHFSDYKETGGIALAIGNFDGFHQGHKAVIERMRERARKAGLKSAVMIFEPQPLEFFGKAVPPRLSSLRDKLKAFQSAGVDIVFCVSFTRDFCNLTPHEFVFDLLRDTMHVREVTVGSLFTFGRNGTASFDDLKELCAQAGIVAEAIAGVSREGTRISSTMIRALLKAGDLNTAAVMLGRPYSISGRVVHGNEIGRTIGFPTANVNLRRQVCPVSGVFAVRVATPYGVYGGVANVGSRPTISPGGHRSLLEVNLFDFHATLYGKPITVFFISKIRDEVKFSGLKELMAQLQHDRTTALHLLAASELNMQKVLSAAGLNKKPQAAGSAH